jgi:hypothetical protein
LGHGLDSWVLEVYETNSEFATADGAADAMSSLKGSARLAATTTVTTNGVQQPPAQQASIALGDDSSAFTETLGMPDSLNQGGGSGRHRSPQR